MEEDIAKYIRISRELSSSSFMQNVKVDSEEEEDFYNTPSSPFQSFRPQIVKRKPISLSPCSDDTKMMGEGEEKGRQDLQIEMETDSSDVPKSTPLHPSIIANNDVSTSKKEQSRLQATFTIPTEPLEENEIGRISTLSVVQGSNDTNKQCSSSKRKKTSTDYTPLEYISSSSEGNSQTISINQGTDDKHLSQGLDPTQNTNMSSIPQDEKVGTALTAFFFAAFIPLWSLGMAFWHFFDGEYSASVITLIIIAISVLAVHVAYFTAKSSPKSKIWSTSKIIALFCAIPGLPPTILSFCNCIFAIREAHSRKYERPWSNTRFVFLVESLVMAFPQCVFHIVLLAEDDFSLPSYKGYTIIVGVALFSFGITFARFRYDTQSRYERFGSGVDKYIRFTYMWATKILWFITYGMVIVSLRVTLPTHQTIATAIGIGSIFLLYEVPILLTLSPGRLGEILSSLLGLLMMIPQFVSLSALILWVNVEPEIYNTISGCTVLGIFFWAEVIILVGWLYDRCIAREIDFIPAYPHFLGDLFTSDNQE